MNIVNIKTHNATCGDLIAKGDLVDWKSVVTFSKFHNNRF